MSTAKKIPDAETRARNVARWREVCLMFDNLNLMLSEAIAQGEAELQNSRIYVRRRERVRRQLEDCRKKQLKEHD